MPNAVVYYNNGQELVPMPTTPVSDEPDANGLYYIQFTTTHFSEYILVEKAYDAVIINKEGKHTFAYGNLNNIMSAARNGSKVVLNKDAQVAATIQLKNNMTIDLNGYNIIVVESKDKIFSGSDTSAVEFTITNSQNNGGNIILNNRALVLTYKPFLIENVSIHQFDANSSAAVKSGEQAKLIHGYSDVEMKNVKINFTLTASGANIIHAIGNAVITNTEIFIENHNTAVFNLQGNSIVEGLKLELPHMRAESIFTKSLTKDLIIRDIEIDALSGRGTPELSLVHRGDGNIENKIIVESGTFDGLTRMVFSTMGTNILVVNGGTFDFNPSAYVDSKNSVVSQDLETQKWVVQSK